MPPAHDAAARRSTLMMAGGAILGLVIAGYGLFTAKGTVVHRVPPEDAALVNQRPILMSDLIAQAVDLLGDAHKKTGDFVARMGRLAPETPDGHPFRASQSRAGFRDNRGVLAS